MWTSFGLESWKPAYAAKVVERPEGLRIYDEAAHDWHLLALSEQSIQNRHVVLDIAATPTTVCDTCLYLHGYGARDLLIVTADGEVLGGELSKVAKVSKVDGDIRVSVMLHHEHPSLFLGMSRGLHARYMGSGNPQWTLKTANVTAATRPEDQRLVLVDVGAAGGLSVNWEAQKSHLHCVFVEPDADEARALRSALDAFPSAEVLEFALADVDAERTLNVTRFPQCSSLLMPDMGQLERYAVHSCFDVVKQIPMQCRRYDGLEAPKPDVIKMDVQGFEYEVLTGFGNLLDDVIAIELEAHFYPIYRGQKLAGDLISFLATKGLRLNILNPQTSFDRDLVELNLIFTRAEVRHEDLWKLDLVRQTFGLSAPDPIGSALAKAYERPANFRPFAE